MKQSTARLFAIVAMVILGIPTILAFVNEGVMGFPNAITFSWASIQIYLDLVIAIVMVMVWMFRDAKKIGRNPWPWIAAAFVVGCFSPLAYLATRNAEEV